MTSTDTNIAKKTNTKITLSPPRQHKVIYINDDLTSMEFVIETLVTVFDHSHETAVNLTRNIHEQGSAVVAVLPFELAEHKGVEVTILARSNGYPLQVKIEPE